MEWVVTHSNACASTEIDMHLTPDRGGSIKLIALFEGAAPLYMRQHFEVTIKLCCISSKRLDGTLLSTTKTQTVAGLPCILRYSRGTKNVFGYSCSSLATSTRRTTMGGPL